MASAGGPVFHDDRPIVGEYKNKSDGKIYGFFLTNWSSDRNKGFDDPVGDHDNDNNRDGDEHDLE
jgi:hypothetical protein